MTKEKKLAILSIPGCAQEFIDDIINQLSPICEDCGISLILTDKEASFITKKDLLEIAKTLGDDDRL